MDLAQATVSWSDWPAPRKPWRSAVAVAVGVAAIGGAASLDPWLAVLGTALMWMATGEVLLPTRYEVRTDGVEIRRALGRRVHPWSRFRGYRRTSDGVALLGEGARPILQRHRTVVVRGAPDQGEAMSLIAAALPLIAPGASDIAPVFEERP